MVLGSWLSTTVDSGRFGTIITDFGYRSGFLIGLEVVPRLGLAEELTNALGKLLLSFKLPLSNSLSG